MPNLKLDAYQTQVRAPGAVDVAQAPQLTPAMFGAGAAAGMKDLGGDIQNGLETINRAAEQSDVSDVNAKMAKARADYTKGLNDTLRTADPGDKTIADKFVQNYDDTIGKIQGDVGTRAGQLAFQSANASLRADLYTRANAGQAELMGVKARSDYQSTVNNLSSSLIENPSDFASVMKQNTDALTGLVATGMLPSDKAEELKMQVTPKLAESAIRGWIRLDPDATEAELMTGKWDDYIAGDQKHQMLSEVKMQKTANEVQANKLRLAAEQERAERANATQNTFLAKLTEGKLTTQEVLNNPDIDAFGSGSKNQFLTMMAEYNRSGGKLQKDSTVFMKLFDQIHGLNGAAPLTNENDINNYVGHGLDMEWATQLRGEFEGKKTTEGQNSAKIKSAMINSAEQLLAGRNPVTGIMDPDGPANYTRFLTNFLKEWETNKQKGISEDQMTDPSNPAYMGYKYRSYSRGMSDVQNSMLNSLNGNVGSVSPQGPMPVPTERPFIDTAKMRQGKETPAQYLKRRRGQ